MEHNDILSKVDRRSGMTVPEGYFDDFSRRMAAQLPRQSWEEPASNVAPKNFWKKVRPYVYLAAMFAGIWCMMKVFDMIHPSTSMDISQNPTLMGAINNDGFYYDYCVSDMSDGDLYEDLYDQGFDPDELDSSN